MGSHTSRNGTQEVLDAVRRIVQSLRESSRRAERHVGVSGAQLFVLQKLAESPSLSVNDLADRTHTHQSSVSTVVARLVDGGLVRRARSGDDGRSVRLSLTPRGARLAARVPGLPQERLVRGVEQLSSSRRRQLASALGALAQAMDAADVPPPMFFEDGPRRRGRHA